MSDKHTAVSRLESRLAKFEGMPELVEKERTILLTEESAHRQLASLVREARELAGLTQVRLGEKAGVAQSRISQIEQSSDMTYGITVGLLARLLAACGLKLQLSYTR